MIKVHFVTVYIAITTIANKPIYILTDDLCVQDMNTVKLLAQILVPRSKAKVFHELTVSLHNVVS